MRLNEFIEKYYPIQDRLDSVRSNPIERVQNADELPCDGIAVIDGVMQKYVQITTDWLMPIADLLTYTRVDVVATGNADFLCAFDAYMENIDLQDVVVQDIVSAVREYRANQQRKEELMRRCTS